MKIQTRARKLSFVMCSMCRRLGPGGAFDTASVGDLVGLPVFFCNRDGCRGRARSLARKLSEERIAAHVAKRLKGEA